MDENAQKKLARFHTIYNNFLNFTEKQDLTLHELVSLLASALFNLFASIDDDHKEILTLFMFDLCKNLEKTCKKRNINIEFCFNDVRPKGEHAQVFSMADIQNLDENPTDVSGNQS